MSRQILEDTAEGKALDDRIECLKAIRRYLPSGTPIDLCNALQDSIDDLLEERVELYKKLE